MSKDNALAGTHSGHASSSEEATARRRSLVETPKGRWERLWPVIACGAGLFSDGYLNGVIGSVSTMLEKIYPDSYKNSPAQSNVSSLAFAGTVVGMLFFGWSSDGISRKWSLFVSTLLVILFAALSAGSYGAGGSQNGLFAALTAYRFLLGIGIGGEYPAGSVGCAESTGELKAGTRNRWFIMFTNVQIDFGFLVAALVPMIMVLITTEKHLRLAWRICLGLGVIPPLSLLYLRLKLQEPEAFQRETMAKAKTPWMLIIRYYWLRLLLVSAIWFIYDFSAYSFGIYSSKIIANLLGDEVALWKSFGWNSLLTFFYMPGCIAGAFLADIPWLGPKKTLAIGVFLQAIVGFIMAGAYSKLKEPSNIGGFVVVYGLFLAFGEAGPGDNIGLVASKTSATAIRGRYYGIAAAMGKVGAFVGSYVIPIVINNAPNETRAGQDPFFVGSSLAVLSGVLVFFLPKIDQDTIEQEDILFREYLAKNGYDTSQLGLKTVESEDSLPVGESEISKV